MRIIKKINNVRNFGILKNIQDNPLYSDFNRFNLIYGLNGSGKSTISHLFSLLEFPSSEKRFADGNWNFIISDSTSLSDSSHDHNLCVRVFDKSFIDNNINWNDVIKGILVVSDTKKEEIIKRDEVKNDLKSLTDSIKKIEIELNGDSKTKGKKGIIKENSNFLTEAAKNIKEKFQLIDVKDTHLSNYNKTKIENALQDKKSIIQKKQLSTTEIEKLSNSIKPQDKNLIRLIELDKVNQLESEIDQIVTVLKSTVTSIILDELKDSPEKSEWAKHGLELHTENESCSFCGNTISKKRIIELNNHFSDSFKKLIEGIEKYIYWVESHEFPELPIKESFYKEFQDEFSELYTAISTKIKFTKTILNNYKKLLEDKKKDPFSIFNKNIPSLNYVELEKAYKLINKLILAHNLKFENLDSTIKKAKSQLEIEYIKAEVKRHNYFQLKKVEQQKSLDLELKIKEKSSLENEIEELDKIISTEALGAEKFNIDLWKFIGRKDISLVPQTKGGYKIERNNDPNTNGKLLSEGEKTAIAFVYFVNKLKEKGNEIKETIIVVDDPISSFDSNNLFSSYSYLKINCNDAKQLFVLTHNFNYFRLVRDWFDGKNDNQFKKFCKGNTKSKTICNIYKLETIINDTGERISDIVDADVTLLNYSSEYHYQFDKLIQYSKNLKTDLDMAYLAANAARKTIETFLKFKYPKSVNNFRSLFEKAIKNTTISDKEEYLYKFINKYSHAQEFDNDSSDNQLDEGINVSSDILKMIEDLDKIHYDEMMEVCGRV